MSVNQLERLWWGLHPDLSTLHIEEGKRRLRSHFVRERSSRLRNDKICSLREGYGYLSCEICGHQESGIYPKSFEDKVFEVHHRVPLADAETPIQTTLDDLALLCANCHRAVHPTKSVDENFNTLIEYFAQ